MSPFQSFETSVAMSCVEDVRVAPPRRLLRCEEDGDGAALACGASEPYHLTDVPPTRNTHLFQKRHDTSYTRTSRHRSSHRRTSSFPREPHHNDPVTSESPWPTITLPTDDDNSVVSELSDLDDDDEDEGDMSQATSCFDSDVQLPTDSWIIETVASDMLDASDTPWFRVLKHGSQGYLMLEGDEVLQLLRAMIKDAASKQQSEPILYTRSHDENQAAIALSASDALVYFRTELKSLATT